MANISIHDFHGGLFLDDHKALSTQHPIAPVYLPKTLVVPLQQHIGQIAEPCIKVGDNVLKGQLIAKASEYVSANIHAPSSGTVTAIDEQPIAHPSGLNALCISIACDGNDTWANLPEPIRTWETTEPQLIRDRLRQSGIVGLGGAVFPTAVKTNTQNKLVDTLILNASECEPYITCDDMLMRTDPEKIVTGAKILQHIVGAKKILIGIEENKPQAIEALNNAINNTDIKLIVVPNKYPSGGEKQLIHLLTGIEIPSQGLPIDVGILCQNVGTCVAVADAVLEGKPFIDRVVTLTGDALAKPQNVRALIGTSIHELIEHHDGFAKACQRTLMGGPMMGFSLPDIDRPIAKGSNCILSLHEVEPSQEPQACIRCGECVKVCPALLLPQQLYWYAKSHNFDQAQDHHLFDCIECGCCAHVCPSKIPLVQYYRFAKTEIWASEREKQQSDLARRRHEFRDARLARLEAERKARLRKKKEVLENKPKAKGDDPKKAAIEAAMKRVAAKKAAQAAEEKSS